jgi:hypothetical protein
MAIHNAVMDDEPAGPLPAPPELRFAEFQRIYGPIEALSPAQAAVLFDGAPFPWWVAGGWSVDRGTEARRFHEDLEIAVPRRDVPALRDWLADYHLWDTHTGALRFLAADVELPDDHEQLWLRRDGTSPWLVDLMLTPVTDDVWFYKRDRRVSRPLDLVIQVGADGIPRQAAEITLLFKARRRWQKDEDDFAAVVSDLEPSDRIWLRDAIAVTEPARHPWLARLG